MKHTLTELYDHLFDSLDSLKNCRPVELESRIKRAAAVRMTAREVIDAAKLEVAVHKARKESSMDGLFPDLKQPGGKLGAGGQDKEEPDGKGK